MPCLNGGNAQLSLNFYSLTENLWYTKRKKEGGVMCGRYTFSAKSDSEMIRQVQESLGARNIEVKTGVVNPGDVAAVIASNRRLEPQVFGMKWGYSLSNGKLVFNARSESASEKALFADGMKQRRCLIPADSYFEWENLEKRKQKYEIAPNGASGFCLAGIYRIEQGRAVFSILTREPAQSIALIHDRMPGIVPTGMASDWLNPRYNGQELLMYAVQNMQYARCETNNDM